MGQQILAVDEVFSGDGAVLISQLLLVQRYTAALYHLAHFTLGWEDRSHRCQHLDGWLSELILANLKLGYPVEDVKQCLLVEFLQSFFGSFSEEDVRGLNSCVEGFL